jgi:hypothetical protein
MKHSCFPQFLVLFLVGVMFTACAPITLIRANVEVEFTRTNVAKLGIVAVPVQRDRMDIRAKNTMQSLFGETAYGRDETLEAVKAQNLDGDLLAALNQYDLQGTLRREVFDAVLDAIGARYMVLMRMQYAGSSVGGWFIFTSLDSSATFNLIVYDRVNGRVVTDVLTNGYASRGLFGGGLIDAAVDQAFDNALSALKARVK